MFWPGRDGFGGRWRPVGVRLVGVLLLLAGSAGGAEVLERAWVPNAWMPQGEVHLVQRGADIAVVSVLWTRHLDLVIDRIAGKEQKGWGDDATSVDYVQALRACGRELGARAGRSGPQALAIAFVVSSNATWVVFSEPEVRKTRSGLEVLRETELKTLMVTNDYVRINQWRILEDAFGSRADAVRARLAMLVAAPAAGENPDER